MFISRNASDSFIPSKSWTLVMMYTCCKQGAVAVLDDPSSASRRGTQVQEAFSPHSSLTFEIKHEDTHSREKSAQMLKY